MKRPISTVCRELCARVLLGLIVGAGSYALLLRWVRSAGIDLVATVATLLGPPARITEMVTAAWDGNRYMIWIAWVSVSVAVAVELRPANSAGVRAAVNMASGAAIFLLAILLLVQAQLSAGSSVLSNLGCLVSLTAVALPLWALRRHGSTAPGRVFDAVPRLF